MEIRFEELAEAGVRRLFEDDAQCASALKSIALAMWFDATKNATRFDGIGRGNLWLRSFFAGIEIRVLFEFDGDKITVWSIAPASPREATE